MTRWFAGFFALVLACAQSRDNEEHIKPTSLLVVALDHGGKPIPDLRKSDLRLVDEGVPQQVTSVRHVDSGGPIRLAILVDFLDLSFNERAATVKHLRRAIVSAPASDSISVYFMLADGQVDPVFRAGSAVSAGPLLDAALQRYTDARPVTNDLGARYHAVSSALEIMDNELSRPGRRAQLLWVTHGVPAKVSAGHEGTIDLHEHLRQLAAQFAQDGITIYTVDPFVMSGGLSSGFTASPVDMGQPKLAATVSDTAGIETLSEASGGALFTGVTLDTALKRINADIPATWVLTYQPSGTHEPKRSYHTVRVACERKGVRIHAQQVYFPRPDLSQQ